MKKKRILTVAIAIGLDLHLHLQQKLEISAVSKA